MRFELMTSCILLKFLTTNPLLMAYSINEYGRKNLGINKIIFFVPLGALIKKQRKKSYEKILIFSLFH